MAAVRGAQEKGWIRPRGEGRPPGKLGVGFCSWVEGTAARGRCHMLNQGVHNLGHPPGSIEGMEEASRLEPFLPDNIECLLFA